jgi:mannosylglycoprotein endo-beta-mannosidase
MNRNAREIYFLKALLNSFAELSGLKINYSKSMMVPINISTNRFDILANTFGCIKGSLPFTYLGLPLSITKPIVADFWLLVNHCERRLVSTATFFSEAGRLELVNVVFSSLPTFAMSTFLLPKTIIKQVDKYRKHCLWRGSDLSSKKPSKAAWEIVCNTKENEGLGVLDLQTQNESLLLKNLHKFYNKANIPWVHLLWACYYSNGSLPMTQVRKSSFWW